ncbi:MAG TPA: DUF2279 domain-containing protein, partial [Flavobacterium sp.]|nr:DUF2279 domain-containing protein [Flavobacterium sp.]
MGLRIWIVLILFSFAGKGFAQSKSDHFLTLSDSLNIQRRNTVAISESILAGSALIGLNQLWYADYAKSDFHFINDNNEWLQMDKAGHVFSSYHLGKYGYELLDWSGVSGQNKLVYGVGLGFAFLTVVEVFDGYSAEWGASTGDLIANATGTGLFVSQQLLWKEQRVTPKFSFHQTHYAALRPDALGSTLNEEILKDYNGQTYWLSANLKSFFPKSKLPAWLQISLGTGAEGMFGGYENTGKDVNGNINFNSTDI